ncbi:MAG: hypothetical protein LBS37_07655, partial [Treponema sp.]|nr:hypothetical protein [Treponema sp.]
PPPPPPVHTEISEFENIERPNYFYCVWQGAVLAKRLGYKRISVIEFGVAGGNGLLALERHAEQISRELQIDIEVYGFDTSEGLPSPIDVRDLPYWWKKGLFHMDNIEELKRRLHSAKLIIGDIRETSGEFFKYDPAPIAAVMHDMDLYSSTKAAFEFFNADEKYLLPRIFNYFDDIIGSSISLFSDFTGERLAINEYNTSHEHRKFSPAYCLLCRKSIEVWYHQIFILHLFDHGRYNDFIRKEEDADPRLLLKV